MNFIVPLVPCVWGPWTEFSQCDKSCGGGKKLKTRPKLVTEKYGGYCDNLAKVVKDCNTHHCPSKLRMVDIKVMRLIIYMLV